MLLPKIQRKSMFPAEVQHAAVQEHRHEDGQLDVLWGTQAGLVADRARRGIAGHDDVVAELAPARRR